MLAAGLKQGRLGSGRVAQPDSNLLRFSHSMAAIARFIIALRLTNWTPGAGEGCRPLWPQAFECSNKKFPKFPDLVHLFEQSSYIKWVVLSKWHQYEKRCQQFFVIEIFLALQFWTAECSHKRRKRVYHKTAAQVVRCKQTVDWNVLQRESTNVVLDWRL